MNKIVYDRKIIEKYLRIFDDITITEWNRKWANLRNELLRCVKPSCYHSALFPEKIESIMQAPPKALVNIFVAYHNQKAKGRISDELHNNLSELFNYTSQQPKIAKFIMSNSEAIGIHSCFYCELSYINTYSAKGRLYNHFDLDHFLPKKRCPIVGLSINNFIPACSVCNEKLKHEHILGVPWEKEDGMLTEIDKDNILRLFPSDKNYNFDAAVTLAINDAGGSALTKTARRKQEAAKDCKLDFCIIPGQEIFQDEIETFRLSERYNYHKMEALRLFDLYNEYPIELREKIRELFNGEKTLKEIEEDLFGTSFSQTHNRCFNKMRRDIAKKFQVD